MAVGVGDRFVARKTFRGRKKHEVRVLPSSLEETFISNFIPLRSP